MSTAKQGAILTRKETDSMEMRVMSAGCSDSDFRKLMDSHESLRNIVAFYTGRTQIAAEETR